MARGNGDAKIVGTVLFVTLAIMIIAKLFFKASEIKLSWRWVIGLPVAIAALIWIAFKLFDR